MNISEIATLAGTTKKFNKTEANKAFLELLAALDPGYIDRKELAGLYNFFKPHVPKMPKTDHGWVSKAMGIKDVRYYLNHLHSDGEKLTATDGHRLHQCVKSELAEGYYDNQLNTIDCDVRYPDVERLIPRDYRMKIPIEDFKEILASSEVEPRGKMGQFVRLDHKEAKLNMGANLKYINDAICGMSETANVFYQPDAPTDKLLFVDNEQDRLAVIMPARL